MESVIEQAEALAWMDAHPAPAEASVITSLPDVSELPELGFEGWRAWFVGAAERVLRWVPPSGLALFYQSDVRRSGGVLVEKSHLVLRASDEAGAYPLFHTIVCRKPPGTIAFGRPSYSHLLAFAKTPLRVTHPPPDVLVDAGEMSWSRAMGTHACRVACRFVAENTATKLIVDPFCGRGSVLRVAKAMGFAVHGVDLSAKRCKAARAALR